MTRAVFIVFQGRCVERFLMEEWQSMTLTKLSADGELVAEGPLYVYE